MIAAFFFNGWEGVVRTIATGVLAYLALVILLRVSGKRTLSKMNAFDLVVTVALGSILAATITSKDTALAEGIAALATLVFLQFCIAWLSVRSHVVSRLVKSEPRLILYKGEFLHSAMLDERIAEEEVHQAIRSHGMGSPDEVAAVVIETNGDLSVVPASKMEGGSSLSSVQGHDSERKGVC